VPRSHFSDTMMEMTSRTRSWPLYVAALWALVCLVVAFTYHINQPIGVLSVTISGHTYTGFPPALTLFESDGASVLVIAGVVACALLMAVIDHKVRQRRNYGGPGIASAIVGVLLVAFSLFGLLWGLASIGVVGLLLIIASQAPAAKVTAPEVSEAQG